MMFTTAFMQCSTSTYPGDNSLCYDGVCLLTISKHVHDFHVLFLTYSDQLVWLLLLLF